MLLFTWNLNCSAVAFELALSYLAASGERFLATFQELPTVATSTSLATKAVFKLVQDRVRCMGVVGSMTTPGRVGLFSSPDLRASVSDVHARMAVASIDGTRRGLTLIGLHAVDRRNSATEYSRGVHGVLLRQGIDAAWKPGDPLIVMGDFNADPYDPEISSRSGIFAIRDSKEMAEDWSSPLAGAGNLLRPLHNPTWHLLPESTLRPGGTYLFNSVDRGIRWRICDQILMSRELVPSVRGLPEILAKMGNEELLTKKGSPNKRHMSDHLPLQLRIQI
jgi:hypothetical protein